MHPWTIFAYCFIGVVVIAGGVLWAEFTKHLYDEVMRLEDDVAVQRARAETYYANYRDMVDTAFGRMTRQRPEPPPPNIPQEFTQQPELPF